MNTVTDDVIVVGDGPAGATAAIYLAKNGMGVHVLGKNHTPMHKALLHNQPGTPGMAGTEFMRIAREQARGFGAHLHDQKVTEVRREGERFEVRTEEGDVYRAPYLVLATGMSRDLAEGLGLDATDEGVRIDIHGRTSRENVYAGGSLVRGLTQAVISAGDGAAIALDILSREKGKPFHDYDVVGRPQARERSAPS